MCYLDVPNMEWHTHIHALSSSLSSIPTPVYPLVSSGLTPWIPWTVTDTSEHMKPRQHDALQILYCICFFFSLVFVFHFLIF